MSVPFSWQLPYAWPRKPLVARNIVCTSQPLAAQAGIEMLAAGGSAVDAAVATAITLTLVEPVSNGIGCGRLRDRLGRQAAARAECLGALARGVDAGVLRRATERAARGWDSVTVPGAVSAWVELHAMFGKLPFEKLFERGDRLRPQRFPCLADDRARNGRRRRRS